MSEEPVLLRDDSGGVRTLTLNRPHRRNAIDEELWRALRDALTDAGERSVRTGTRADRGRSALLLHQHRQELGAAPPSAWRRGEGCAGEAAAATSLAAPGGAWRTSTSTR